MGIFLLSWWGDGRSKSQSDFIPIRQRSLEIILRSAAAFEPRAIASMSISDIDIDTWLSRSMSRKDRRKTKIWKNWKKAGSRWRSSIFVQDPNPSANKCWFGLSEFGAPTVMRVHRVNQNARVRLEYLPAESKMLCRMLVLRKENFQVKNRTKIDAKRVLIAFVI